MEIPNTAEWQRLLKKTPPTRVLREASGIVYLPAEPHLTPPELRWLQRTAKTAPAYFYRLPPNAIHAITRQPLGHPRPNSTVHFESGTTAKVRMVLLPKSRQSRSLTGLALLQQ